MAPKVWHDYSGITEEWLLGEMGSMSDHARPINALPNEFDPPRARSFLGYMQCGMTIRQAAEEAALEYPTVIRWKRGALGAPDSFVAAFEAAREIQVHAMADDVIDIADGTDSKAKEALKTAVDEDNDMRKDFAKQIDKAVARVVDSAGNRMSARKWYVSKILPSYYGDRVQLDHGNAGGKPFKQLDMSKLSDKQIDKLIELDEELRSTDEA